MNNKLLASTTVLAGIVWLAVASNRAWAQDHSAHGVDNPHAAPMLEGLGSLHHPVTTSSTEAQRYFDQGLRLVFAFNHEEAIRSFEQAAALDANCAMAYWGVALALGPNINLPTDPDREKTAREMVAKAIALKSKVSAAERNYIDAVAKRYPERVTDRAAADLAFANAMRELAAKYPDDLDAATLFAEAMMDLRPWRLWNADGTPAPGTAQIVATLESVLKRNPQHPGANHYYIHTMEGSPHPERALAAADRLPQLMPGAGHIVHMPAHIYIHTSRWHDASISNERAIEVDRKYLAASGAQGMYPMMYATHNYQFLAFSAAMEGRSRVALEAAKAMNERFSADMVKEMEASMPGFDYFLSPLLFNEVRFGKWQEILATPAPPQSFNQLTAVWHFARGMALLRTGKAQDAIKEHAALARFTSALSADAMLGTLNTAKSVFEVATGMLAGEIEASSGRFDQAERLLREAAMKEDALGYDEPPPWWQPVRLSLGELLLKENKAHEAETVFRETLKTYPENGWALFGLANALERQKSPHAAAIRERFEKAWSQADVKLTAARF